LLFANPLFWFLPTGLWVLFRRGDAWWSREGILTGTYIGGILLFPEWWAGWAPAARHLVPVIPLLWYPAFTCLVLAWSGSLLERLVARALAALTAFLVGYWWHKPMQMWPSLDGNNRWMESLAFGGWNWQTLLPGYFPQQSWSPGLILSWSGILVALTLWLIRRTGRTFRHR
jgi:hypothetical protein